MASRALFVVCALVALVAQVQANLSQPGAPSSGNQPAEPLSEELLSRQRKIHSEIYRKPEAFAESDRLVDELNKLANQEIPNSFDRKQVLSMLVRVRRDRVAVLIQREQFVAALLETYEIKSTCSRNPDIDCVPWLVDNYLSAIQAEIQSRGPYGLLGLEATAGSRDVQAARSRLLQLLQSHQNQNQDEELQQARQNLTAKVEQVGERPNKPLDAELIRRQRNIHLNIDRDSEAFADSERLVDELVRLASQATPNSFDRSQVLSMLVQVRRDRVSGLMQRKQFVEALLETYEIKSTCSRNPDVDCVPWLVDQFLTTIEAEIERQAPYGLLGLSPTATAPEVEAAQRRLLQLLNPAKNRHLDDESRQLCQALYARVAQAGIQPANKPLSVELLTRQREIHSQIYRNPEVLKEAERLADELHKLANEETPNSFDRKQVVSMLVQVHRDRIGALIQRKQFVEAQLEAHQLKSICSRDPDIECASPLADQYLSAIETEVHFGGPYGLLGLSATASPREVQAVRSRLTQLLQSCQDRSRDEELQQVCRNLLERVKQP